MIRVFYLGTRAPWRISPLSLATVRTSRHFVLSHFSIVRLTCLDCAHIRIHVPSMYQGTCGEVYLYLLGSVATVLRVHVHVRTCMSRLGIVCVCLADFFQCAHLWSSHQVYVLRSYSFIIGCKWSVSTPPDCQQMTTAPSQLYTMSGSYGEWTAHHISIHLACVTDVWQCFWNVFNMLVVGMLWYLTWM